MGEIVSLSEEKEKRSPHLAGRARCLDCSHEWVAVAPVGTMTLECPACKSMKGLWTYTFSPDYEKCLVYACLHCSSTHFSAYMSQDGSSERKILCVGCGSQQSLQSLFD